MENLHIKKLLYTKICSLWVLELDTRHDWWVMAPNTHHSLIRVDHLCILTHTSRKLFGWSTKWTTALLSDIFLVWFRVTQTIQLGSYRQRHTSNVLLYNIACVYCKSIYKPLFCAQLRMTTILTHLMTAHYTPKNGFTANNALFYMNTVG